MKKILDIKIIKDKKRQIIRLNQTYYLREILDRINITIKFFISIDVFLNEYDVLKFFKFNDKRVDQS